MTQELPPIDHDDVGEPDDETTQEAENPVPESEPTDGDGSEDETKEEGEA